MEQTDAKYLLVAKTQIIILIIDGSLLFLTSYLQVRDESTLQSVTQANIS